MNKTFFSHTVNVLFFSFLTLFSTFTLLEKYGAQLLIWRAGFEWAGELNTLSVLVIFLCGGVLVSLLTAYAFHLLARVAVMNTRGR